MYRIPSIDDLPSRKKLSLIRKFSNNSTIKKKITQLLRICILNNFLEHQSEYFYVFFTMSLPFLELKIYLFTIPKINMQLSIMTSQNHKTIDTGIFCFSIYLRITKLVQKDLKNISEIFCVFNVFTMSLYNSFLLVEKPNEFIKIIIS